MGFPQQSENGSHLHIPTKGRAHAKTKTVQFDEFVTVLPQKVEYTLQISTFVIMLTVQHKVLPRSVYRSIEYIRDKRQKQGRILGACWRQTSFPINLKKGDNKVQSDTRTFPGINSRVQGYMSARNE